MAANLSACGQVDSEVLVGCLRDKTEEEILAINKVGLNGRVYGRRVGSMSFTFSGQVIPSPRLGVLTALGGKRSGYAKPAAGPLGGEDVSILDELGRGEWDSECIRKCLGPHFVGPLSSSRSSLA